MLQGEPALFFGTNLQKTNFPVKTLKFSFESCFILLGENLKPNLKYGGICFAKLAIGGNFIPADKGTADRARWHQGVAHCDKWKGDNATE